MDKSCNSKVYNSVLVCVKHYEFGNSFMKLATTSSNGTQSCLNNENHSIKYFNVTRGTRHGEPLLPRICTLAFTALFIRVRIKTQSEMKSLKLVVSRIVSDRLRFSFSFIKFKIPLLFRF